MTLVAMYHYVRDVESEGIRALRPRDFQRQLDWLAQNHRVITFDEFEAAAAARRSIDGSTALLTFDDGFVDHYSPVYEELRRRGLSGVFFLAGATLSDSPRVLNVHKAHLLIAHLGAERFDCELRDVITREPALMSEGLQHRAEVYRYDAAKRDVDIKHLLNYELPYEVVDRVLGELFRSHLGDEIALAKRLYLSTTQIREMAGAGMVFGFHTEQHRVLSRLTPTEQRQEVERGAELIRLLTGQPSVPFCYPYGHVHTFNTDSVAILSDSGYSVAFTTERRWADTARDDRFQIPRFDARDLPPFVEAPHA